MALACRCDRCQKLYSPDGNERIKKVTIELCSIYHNDLRGGIKAKSYDLCPSCINFLENWLNGSGNNWKSN